MIDDVTWLVDEVNELLAAGRVGLYEFVEILRTRYTDTPVVELQPICRTALDRLLDDRSVRLGRYVWATGREPEPASITEVQPTTFDEIGHDPYLAIERT
jgi:hypothetical protein